MQRFWTGVVLAALAASAVFTGATRADAKIGDVPVDDGALTKLFKVVKQTYDADKGEVVWILESKQKIGKTTNFELELQDGDGAAIGGAGVGTREMDFNPSLLLVNAGDSVRAVVKLPDEKLMKKVKKAVVKQE